MAGLGRPRGVGGTPGRRAACARPQVRAAGGGAGLDRGGRGGAPGHPPPSPSLREARALQAPVAPGNACFPGAPSSSHPKRARNPGCGPGQEFTSISDPSVSSRLQYIHGQHSLSGYYVCDHLSQSPASPLVTYSLHLTETTTEAKRREAACRRSYRGWKRLDSNPAAGLPSSRPALGSRWLPP